ncbi:TniQ family protein [Fibrobacter sp. UWH9]|uniref:TniQ family protein n=1 Tax=Fibrobacter sp. UWH9 TaxID=1896213 RepID=UPI0009331BE8|nr:TniQ family protein [Fibrobacter sp. UWH9]
MIAYLPDIYPDELIYSWICRYHAHIGYPDETRTFMDLLDPLEQKISHEFSATFNTVVLDLIRDSFGGMADFIRMHTLYNYYAIFLDHGTAEAYLNRLQSGIHSVGFRAPQFIRVYRMLRYCPRCVQEDRFTYGEAYYHVSHQIPDVNVCLRHHCRLENSNVRIYERHPVALTAADAAIPQDNIAVDADELEVRYAVYLMGLIGKRIPFSRNNLHGRFRSAISDDFVDNDTGVIDTFRLAESITARFQKLGTGVIPAHEIETVLLGRIADCRLIALLGFYFGINFDLLEDSGVIESKGILPSEWKRL